MTLEKPEKASDENGSRAWCDRQADSWACGMQTPIEHFVLESPELADDESILLDLVYNEVLLREKYAQPARLEEYETRFPHLATALRRMFEVHAVIEGGSLPSSSGQRVDPADDTHPTGSSQPPIGLPKLSGYRFIEQIGRGAMGIVYRARQTGTDRDVAVKVFYGGLDASDEEVARFGIEAQAAARLRHPSIVTIFEAGAEGDVHFLAMEWIEGCTLAQRLAERPLPPREAAVIVETIARAVHYANEAGIIHRDLKPHNILLDRDGAPHVADFGLARFNDRNTTWTTGGRILGTLHYMSPEQVRGDQNAIGPGTDVYGLGAVLFQCLTGEPPFADRTAPQLVHDLLHRDPVLANSIGNDIPTDLAQICRKSLEKDPNVRYPNAAAFANDLQAFVADMPVTARPLRRSTVAWRAIKRRPTVSGLVVMTGVLIVCSLVGAVVVADQFRESGIELSRVRERADAAEAVGLLACIESQLSQTDQRLRSRTASDRNHAFGLIQSTIELSKQLPPNAVPTKRLRNQAASALSDFDVTMVAGDASLGFSPPPESIPTNSYSVVRGPDPDSLMITNGSEGTTKSLSTGFDIEGFRVHPYVPVVAVWNVNDLHLINLDDKEGEQIVITRATRRIQSADWSECGALLAIGSADHFVYILQYEPQTREAFDQPSLVLKGARSWVNRVRFMRNRLLMASCRGGDRTRLYDCDTGEEIISFRGFGNETDWQGNHIRGTLDGKEVQWKVSPPEVKSLFGVAQGINGACGLTCNARSDRFLVCEWEEVTLWDAHDGHVLDKVPASNPMEIGFIGDERAVFVDDTGVHYLDLSDTAEKRSATLSVVEQDDTQHDFADEDLAFSCQFPVLAIPRASGLELFGIDHQRLKFRETVNVCGVTHATCSRDGRWLVTSVDTNPGFLLFNLEKGGPPTEIVTDEAVVGFRFDVASQRLVVAELSGCHWYDVAAWERLGERDFKTPVGMTFGMEWSSDGKLIALANRYDAIDLIDAATSKLLVSLPVPQNGSWLRFSTDGASLLCRDSSFRLVAWDLQELRHQLDELGLNW